MYDEDMCDKGKITNCERCPIKPKRVTDGSHQHLTSYKTNITEEIIVFMDNKRIRQAVGLRWEVGKTSRKVDNS